MNRTPRLEHPRFAGAACSIPVVLGGVLCLGCLLPSGCQKPTKSEFSLPSNVVHPEALGRELYLFGQIYGAAISGTASKIAALTKDREIREMTLRWKMLAIPAMNLAVTDPDPRQGFLEAWALVVRGRQFLQSDQENLLGDQQPLAKETLARMEEEILSIGRKTFGEEMIVKASEEMERIAQQLPYQMSGSQSPIKVMIPTSGASGSTAMMNEFLKLPLAPFRGLEGVKDTSGAINNFSQTVQVLGEMVRGMPERIRWQTELLLLEIESSDSMTKWSDGIERTSKSLEALTKTADALPAEVRRQLDAAIASAGDAQEKFRATLQEADKTLQGLNTSIASADGLAKSVKDGSGELARTAAAWEATAKAVEAVLKTWQEIAAPKDKPEPAAAAAAGAKEEKSASVEDYGRMAAEIRGASVELRGLLNDLDSDRLSSAIAQAGDAAEPRIDHLAGRLDSLVNRFVLLQALLVLLLLLAAIVYRVVSQKIH